MACVVIRVSPEGDFDRAYVNAEDLSFPGTFHGVAGTAGMYDATLHGQHCGNDGMISSAGDTWTFTHRFRSGWRDHDRSAGRGPSAHFGWWLKEPTDVEGAYAFRTFSGGTVPFAVGDKFTSGHTDGLLGTASYLKAGRRVLSM